VVENGGIKDVFLHDRNLIKERVQSGFTGEKQRSLLLMNACSFIAILIMVLWVFLESTVMLGAIRPYILLK